MKLILSAVLVAATFISTVGQTRPAGEVRGPFVWRSKIYPGTERNYWIYVPKQYDSSKPACTMVVQDGLSRANGWHLTTILDSLIDLRQIPVIVGIFIDHGKVASAGIDNYPRFNRSFEYDGMGDRYARFLLEELLPEISRTYNLSKDPNDRSIAGASSGAICAFNAAWERPDEFRRVLSTIGTYVGLRGGDEFATLVRKTEPKPLRVFLEDGDHDLNIYAGDWWAANQDMLSALTWSGYEVNHAWGSGGHDSAHALSIMAEALVWLWKDYPAPVQTHRTSTQRVNPALEGEDWTAISTDNISATRLAVGPAGEVYLADKRSVHRLDSTGRISLIKQLQFDPDGVACDEKGTLYVSDHQNRVSSIDRQGVVREVGSFHAAYMALTSRGIYFTEGSKDRIGFFSFARKAYQYFPAPGITTGLAVSADQTFLSVALANGVMGYSFKINDDGALDFGQEYIHFHIPYGSAFPGAGGMTVDSDNLLYTSTAMGVQVSDQLGRVNFIFSKPIEGAGDVKIGGPKFDRLYCSINGKLFSRKIKARGVLSVVPPVKPPRPGM